MIALKSRLEEQVAELNDTRGAEIEMRNNLEEQQKSLQENIKRLKYWQDKLGRLAIQNVRSVVNRTNHHTPYLSFQSFEVVWMSHKTDMTTAIWMKLSKSRFYQRTRVTSCRTWKRIS